MPPRLPSRRVLSSSSIHTPSRTASAVNAARSLVTCRSPPYPGKVGTLSLSRAVPSRNFHASSIHSAPKDPYQVLGVKKEATAAEIKNAYFALAQQYHPDKSPDKDAQVKFVEIQAAYDTLKDSKRRAAFDKFGPASQQPGFDANAYENARSYFGERHGFDDIPNFGSLFGSRGRGTAFSQMFDMFNQAAAEGNKGQHGRGANIEATISISFMEACKGVSRTVNITPIVMCNTCSGTGLKAGAKRSTCPQCSGTGSQRFLLQEGFHMETTCHSCSGTGFVVPPNSECGTCRGQGAVRTRKTVNLNIPAGVEDGLALRVDGHGDAPLGGVGRAGDLYVRINVAPSKVFKRQGANLFHEVKIPVHTALLGGRVRVPTLDGEVDVRIPAGTQPGEQMVLKGHGVTPADRRTQGDLFVTFNIQVPRSLTSRQRELLQQFADDVEGKTVNPSRQDTRQESPPTSTADEPISSSSRASTQAGTETETHTNDSFTEQPESEAADKHKKRDQDRKKRATA